MRVIFFVLCLALSAAAAYYGEPYIHNNPDAVLVLVTVFTVFAGFLVGVITVVGDPALLPGGSWRLAEVRRDSIEARLVNHIWLFRLYLIAIGLLFATVIVHKAPDEIVSECVKLWIGRLCLFMGVLSFLLTFGLPGSLLKLQMARIDAEIRRRRREVGIQDDRE